MLKRSIFYFMAIPVILLNSCKDTSDYSQPVVNILSPQAGFSMDIPDTMEIRAEITDDRIIRSITVTLLNEDKIPVAPAKYFSPNIYHFNLSTSLIVSDKSLQSGTYTLMVAAFDGSQESRSYIAINLNEVPKELAGYIAINSSFSPQSIINRMNTKFEIDTAFIIPKSFLLSGVHGLWGQFCFVSDNPSLITAYSLDKFEVNWEFAAAPPIPVFSALWIDHQIVFATLNGDAGILNSIGNIILRTPVPAAKSIQCMASDDHYIYAEHVSLSGALTELTVYYRLTGAMKTQYLIKQDIVSLVPANKMVLVFTNKELSGIVNEYDPELMKMTELKKLGQDVIKSVVKINEKVCLIVASERVLVYERINNQVYIYIDEEYDFIRYDGLYDHIFLVRGNDLKVLKWKESTLVHHEIFDEDLLDFQVIYNK